MMKAERAHKIIKLYEADYDNFLDKLRAKIKNRKKKGDKAGADKASKNLKEAEDHKKTHLGQKAKDLLDKVGGIEGASSTVKNVMGYIKNNDPSDYEVNMGGSGENKADNKKGDTIFGMPAIAVYVGGTLVVLGICIGGYMYLQKDKAKQQQQFPINPSPLTQAA